MQIGDFIKGKPESSEHYSITTEKMTKALVTEVQDGEITIRVMEHENNLTGIHTVTAEYFEVIGHQKPFNRDEVLALLMGGCKKALLDYDLSDADLSGADLRRADLSGADLDFSCWPLWCGSLKVKTDKRLARQLAFHLCSMQCEDVEYIKMRNSILDFANQFHRVDECGKLEPIDMPEADKEA